MQPWEIFLIVLATLVGIVAIVLPTVAFATKPKTNPPGHPPGLAPGLAPGPAPGYNPSQRPQPSPTPKPPTPKPPTPKPPTPKPPTPKPPTPKPPTPKPPPPPPTPPPPPSTPPPQDWYTNVFMPNPADYGHEIKGESATYVPKNGDYIMAIGDWGETAGSAPQACQGDTASLMTKYATKHGMPLVVLALGDNFYWTGTDASSADRWNESWVNYYGALTSIPWLVVLGNHDVGNGDKNLLCPENAGVPVRGCTVSYSPDGYINSTCTDCDDLSSNNTCQLYDCGQMTPDKILSDNRPSDVKKNYHLPDFSYYYCIPSEEDCVVEVIAIDRNYIDYPGWGGDGMTKGASEVAGVCGGQQPAMDKSKLIYDAGQALLEARAQKTTAKFVIIINHYPGAISDADVALFDKSVSVIQLYGHTHEVQCQMGGDANPDKCTTILAGHGGGCCSGLPQTGFVTIQLEDVETGVFSTNGLNCESELCYNGCPGLQHYAI